MRRGVRGIPVVGLALAALFAAPVRAAPPYDINAILPLSGGAAFLGHGEQQALELSEKAVNASGGIRGRKLHFIYHDDETTPQVAVQFASQIIAKKPAALIVGSPVAECRAAAALMSQGPVDYCSTPGIHPDKGSYIFSATVSTLDLANALIHYFRDMGWTRVALMFSSDATGQDAEDGLKKILALPENKAMTIVEVAHFNITDVSVSAQIENVKAAKPQCFIAWSTGAPIATIFRGMADAGLDVPTATTDGNMTYAQMKAYASFMPKQLYIPAGEWVVHDPSRLSPGVAKQHKVFYDAFAAIGAKPDSAAELVWDPSMIIVDALRTLGPDAKAAQVRHFMTNLRDYPGIDGIYDFVKVPQRGIGLSNAVVTRWSASAQTWEVVNKPASAAPKP
jgi:branched-chain amino acid transport system substrate-binding protein